MTKAKERVKKSAKDRVKQIAATEEAKADVVAMRALQDGDVLDVVRRLRQLMSHYENCTYALYASFKELGGSALEQDAQKARHTLELATARIAQLLSGLERTTPYQSARKAAIRRQREQERP